MRRRNPRGASKAGNKLQSNGKENYESPSNTPSTHPCSLVAPIDAVRHARLFKGANKSPLPSPTSRALHARPSLEAPKVNPQEQADYKALFDAQDPEKKIQLRQAFLHKNFP